MSLLLYMARSAQRASVSKSSPSPGNSAMPMLALTCAVLAARGSSSGVWIARSSRSTVTDTCSRLPACVSSTRNSSPLTRQTMSDSRSVATRRWLMPSSSSSPAAWPIESLTALKRSRSMNSSAQLSCWRRAAAASCWNSSRNSVRLGRPVRWSYMAILLSCLFLASSSSNSSWMRARTVFRCWPSWPSSSRWRQTSAGTDSRAASVLACSFRRWIGRSRRSDSTPSSTITPTTTCAATSHHMMSWRWATSWSVSVASKLRRRLATSWPSCSTGASRTTTGRPGAQRCALMVSGPWVGCRSRTSTAQTDGSCRMRCAAAFRPSSLSVQAGSVTTAVASTSTAARLRCTSGSCAERDT